MAQLQLVMEENVGGEGIDLTARST
jgi:hypothetical protein